MGPLELCRFLFVSWCPVSQESIHKSPPLIPIRPVNSPYREFDASDSSFTPSENVLVTVSIKVPSNQRA
jgi:hypothetical protein